MGEYLFEIIGYQKLTKFYTAAKAGGALPKTVSYDSIARNSMLAVTAIRACHSACHPQGHSLIILFSDA